MEKLTFHPEAKPLDKVAMASRAHRRAEEECERANTAAKHDSALNEYWLDHARSYLDGTKKHLTNLMSHAIAEGEDPTEVAKAVIAGAEG